MSLRPHTNPWYDRLAQMQRGYYYPWRSTLAPGNGENAYLSLVQSHLAPDKDVLDAGCGHGEVALDIAPLCRSVLAYDRIPSFIELAEAAGRERGVANVIFRLADSSAEANGGQPHIPADPASIDLFISRRGPLHWIEDVRRVARPGAVLLQLNPIEAVHLPAWNDDLPSPLRMSPPDFNMRQAVERRLALAGLDIHSCWIYDVPEYFDAPDQLYVRLAWGYAPDEVPTYAEVQPIFEGVFARFAGPDGLIMRHRRFLWKAVVE